MKISQLAPNGFAKIGNLILFKRTNTTLWFAEIGSLLGMLPMNKVSDSWGEVEPTTKEEFLSAVEGSKEGSWGDTLTKSSFRNFIENLRVDVEICTEATASYVNQ